tara:strand:- start:13 stop:321 length:309 start_codon:yes stop_codon:yes gene_type:complete
MAWIYIAISIGLAGFLVWIIVDYLNVFSGLKPKAQLARQEIRECEMRIKSELVATSETKQEVDTLQQEISDLEKELDNMQKKVKKVRAREQRRKPTKFKLED